MKRVNLGNSNLKVSILGLGCSPLGGGGGWGNVTKKEAEDTVHAALDLGINLFDTAESYNAGRSEEMLGYALRGRRNNAIIATKISPQNTNPETLKKHCAESLKRLKTDYIDLYQVHWPILDSDPIPAFLTLKGLIEEGQVRAVGVSNFGLNQLKQALSEIEIASNQVCYNLVSRAVEYDILPFCSKHGIAIITYMPLMQGLLAGLYESYFDMPPKRATTRHFSSVRPHTLHQEAGFESELFGTLKSIASIANDAGLAMADLSLAWVLSKPAVSSVLIGSREPGQLARNTEALKIRLTPEVIARIDNETSRLKKIMGPSADYWFSGDETRSM